MTTALGSNTREQLKSFVDRIEKLEDDKSLVAADIKDVYAEAKSTGFDVKTLRQVIRIRKQDATKREEQEALLDVYLHALGDTPIERAIADQAA